MSTNGIRPDVCIIGKALSGGFYPVSAVLASREILGVFQPGDHGSTFGGNPLACAVARAALRVIVDEKLPQRSAELGAYALERLRGIRSNAIVQVRGKGLWIGIELTIAARPVCEALQRRGVLCKETHDTVIRLAPPFDHQPRGPGVGAGPDGSRAGTVLTPCWTSRRLHAAVERRSQRGGWPAWRSRSRAAFALAASSPRPTPNTTSRWPPRAGQAMLPFAWRQLAPLLVRAIGILLHLSLGWAFLIEGGLALATFLGITLVAARCAPARRVG